MKFVKILQPNGNKLLLNPNSIQHVVQLRKNKLDLMTVSNLEEAKVIPIKDVGKDSDPMAMIACTTIMMDNKGNAQMGLYASVTTFEEIEAQIDAIGVLN